MRISASYLILIAAWFVAGSAAAETREQLLHRLEAALSTHFQSRASEQNDAFNKKVDAHNEWVQTIGSAIETRQAAIQKEYAGIETKRAEIDAVQKAIRALGEPKSRDALETYNALVERNNALAADFNLRVDAYEKRAKQLNAYIDEFNLTLKRRQQALETERASLDERIAATKQFFADKKDQAYSEEVNRMYASLIRDRRQARPNSVDARALDDAIRRVVSLRHALADDTLRRNAESDSPMIYAEVIFPGGVTGLFLVDTGARSVTITPELVEALGLSDRLGEETELTLAGGMTAKGRRIALPEMTAGGQTARNVSAVVLPDSTVGVDGLLGRSFLMQFDMTISAGRVPVWRLEPARAR